MGDLVVGVGGILLVVEDDLIDRALLRAHHQSLLERVGHHAGNRNEGFGHDSLAVVADGLRIRDRFAGCLVQILDRVRHRLLLDVPEGVDVRVVFLRGVDVQRQGVALGYREVALLIVGIQIRAALGLEGLGNAGETAARGGGGNFGVGVLNLIIDGIRLQDVGVPLAVDLQILFDGHVGEVECLLHAVLHVEPADEFVGTVLGILRSGSRHGAMGNGDVRMGGKLGSRSKRIRIQIELHGVRLRHPLGVEQHIFRRHGVLIQLVLRAGALRVEIPAAKGDGTGLVGAGDCGHVIVVRAQRSLILHGFRLDVVIAIIEGQLVEVAGVVEGCASATAAILGTMMIGKAFKLVPVLIRNVIAANSGYFKQLYRVISVQILPPVGHCASFTRCSAVVVSRAGLGHHAEVVGVGGIAARFSRPEGRLGVRCNRLILHGNIRAPLGRDGFSALIIPIAVVIFKCQRLFRAVVVDVHDAGTIGGDGDGFRFLEYPQVGIQTRAIHVAIRGVGMRGLATAIAALVGMTMFRRGAGQLIATSFDGMYMRSFLLTTGIAVICMRMSTIKSDGCSISSSNISTLSAIPFAANIHIVMGILIPT